MNDLREVDLERGMPRAEQAIRQMLFELRRSPGLGCSAVKLIHGYGSSGAGRAHPGGGQAAPGSDEGGGRDLGLHPRRVLLHL